MTAITLPASDLFSVITTGDRRHRSALWPLPDLFRAGDAHVDYAADTDAQRNLWAVRLDEAVRRAERPVLLVASGASCFAAAWWARLSPSYYVSQVAGALLFDPLGHGGDAEVAERFASPHIALPFPSAIIGRDTRRDSREPLHLLAEGWGGAILDMAADQDQLDAGGAWQQAHAFISRATARVVERRMRVADALGLID
ncbi:alpha/beta hydrolase [Sphingomonas sp. ERG5]|uniref:alpha/beta hydrolase n=1 Tax=Sphingomonas sp. ERG5 TaxID=1381597 RepID=UPI00054B877F|nr:alpha/beta hydrolase [Sphingomonas sp. ERG5]